MVAPLMRVMFLQAIIHPDTGEKILMPFRMSGTVAWCGSLGGLVMWSNVEAAFTLGTVTAPRGSSGCLGARKKVTLSWALIKTSLPRWRRTYSRLSGEAKGSIFGAVSKHLFCVMEGGGAWYVPTHLLYVSQDRRYLPSYTCRLFNRTRAVCF